MLFDGKMKCSIHIVHVIYNSVLKFLIKFFNV